MVTLAAGPLGVLQAGDTVEVTEAMGAALIAVGAAVTVASDPAAVSQWFRGKLDIPVRPVMFRGMPARLVGARISNVRDQMAAALYYDVGGRRVTVFVFDPDVSMRQTLSAQGYYVTSSHGYTVTLTEQQGVGYAIASDMPAQDAVRIVRNAELR